MIHDRAVALMPGQLINMAMMAVRVSMAKVVVLVDVPSTMTVIVGVAGSGVSMR